MPPRALSRLPPIDLLRFNKHFKVPFIWSENNRPCRLFFEPRGIICTAMTSLLCKKDEVWPSHHFLY